MSARRKQPTLRTALVLAGLFGAVATAQAAPICYHNYGSIDANKPNKLFLYFPTTDDPTFPAYGTGTSPARTFDIALLPGGPAGTTGQLRNRIHDVVATAYCEFNVQVLPPTTSNPNALVSPPARRNIIAIGADSAGGLFGQAEAVDNGDADVIDHGRVWAGSYASTCSGQLSGADNTLDRWAYGIGGTAAHEAGHNYGLSHGSGILLKPGEDAITNHLMPAGSNIPCSDRVGHLRHFSDTDFGILANNVGLTLQSLANWDFINPNAGNAHALRMEVLSLSNTLTPVSTYTGIRSPWNPPTVSGPLGTKVFKGTVYKRFLVTWNAAKAWDSTNMSSSINGVVRGGEIFHIGTHFAEENIGTTSTHVVISDVELLGVTGGALALAPRVPTFGTGNLAADGTFSIAFANLLPANLILKNLQAFVLPRPLHIDSMMLNKAGELELFDVAGEAVQPWRKIQLPEGAELPAGSSDKPGEVNFTLGNLFKDGRNVRIKTRSTPRDNIKGDAEVNPDIHGALLTDPFPGASVFVVADLIEPGATQWDPEQKQYVSRDMTTKVFVQVAGKRAKPVEGILIGLRRSKVVCTNLNTRKSVTVTPAENGSFDCEAGGLISLHGDRVQITQTGQAISQLPAVQMGGMDIGKVSCTNLNTRETVSFTPKGSTEALDCARNGLKVQVEQTLQVSQVGTVR